MAGVRMLLRRVSVRRLHQRRLRAALTMIGIGGGVTLLVAVTLINGTLQSSVQRSAQDVAGQAQIEVAATDQAGLPESTVDTVASVPGTTRVVPMVRVTSRLEASDAQARSLVLGVPADFPTLFADELNRSSLHVQGGFGRDRAGIVLSAALAQSLRADRGETIRISTPTGGAGVQVTGIVSGEALKGVNGGRFGVMQLPAAQAAFRKQGRIDSVYVRVAEAASVEGVEQAIRDRLGGAGLVGPPGERVRGFERTFEAIASLGSLAGVVSLFVALFVVYISMSMSFAERRRELSLAMALGADRRQLFATFMAEAGLLGTVASLGGAIAGIAMAKLLVARALEAYRIFPVTSGGPLVIDPLLVLLALAAGIAVSLLGAYVPARTIMRVAPMESLRPVAAYEGRSAPFAGTRRPRALAFGLTMLLVGAIGALASARQESVQIGLVAGFMIALMAGMTLLLPHFVAAATAVVRPLLLRFGTSGRLAADVQTRNPGRTALTVGALLLTSALVVGVGTAIQSYEQQFATRAGGWFGAPLYVQTDSYTGLQSDQPLPASLADRFRDVPGIAAVYPMRYAVVDLGTEPLVIYAWAVAEAADDGVTRTLSSTGGDQEAFVAAMRGGSVMASRYFGQRYDLDAGDEVTLPTGAGSRSFAIADLFDDLSPISSMFMEYRTYADTWNDDMADRFAVLTLPGADRASVAGAIGDVIETEGIPARVLTREQIVDELLGSIRSLVALAQAIQLAGLLVAGLAVANTMFTTVLERRWEFGVQRTVGMERRQLGRIVLLESGAIGVIGAIGGVLAGLMIGFLMTRAMHAGFAWRVPFDASPPLLAAALIGSTLVAIASGAYPSRLAARGEIIAALRYE